jgi:hypothetical protein
LLPPVNGFHRIPELIAPPRLDLDECDCAVPFDDEIDVPPAIPEPPLDDAPALSPEPTLSDPLS